MKTVNLVLTATLLLSSPLLVQAATSAPAAAVTMRHAQPITIRDTVIGAGMPKIIVPTTGNTADAVLQQAAVIGHNADADLIEYRIDYLDFATDPAAISALGQKVAQAAQGKPLILTFRTKAEGGAKAISDADYGKLYLALIKDHFIDLLDVEMFRNADVVHQLVAAAHQAGIKVIMSSHDFQKTPSSRDIVSRLRQQDALGADILKIAVMPHSPEDVLTLLNASEHIREKYSRKPLLTMAMGGTGAISRLSGEVFASDLTFGMIGEASAPGQLDVARLHQVLAVIHQAAGTH
ncbi:type I 3-dehydroquinate dehydratase [Erwinia sp. V71]|uniref:type I 3-dehydroquinate dehydratase n=1 Tax=Erwinia sp. V71 TaxID=3369424 RepID=UPI003F5F9C18